MDGHWPPFQGAVVGFGPTGSMWYMYLNYMARGDQSPVGPIGGLQSGLWSAGPHFDISEPHYDDTGISE
jgi:hypothetical protein